ncbi:MAG: HAMP domain-containing protein [Bacteroidales bacterium]|nr:HAMP domain-containing protein [Bacteroidales bacterium]
MKRFHAYLGHMPRFSGKYITTLLFGLALLLLGLSFLRPDYEVRLKRQTSRVERRLHKRELLAERYAYLALQASGESWVDFDDMPDDIVLYCYQADTMKSWTHQFPISNDEVDVYPYSYRLHFMSNRNLYATPLAYIGMREKYVNLGSGWYVVTTHFDKDQTVKVVTGILIKTEYPSSAVPNIVNRRLGLRDGYTTVPISEDDNSIVTGIEDEPLFSVIPQSAPSPGGGNMPLRWVAFALMLLAVFPWHFRKHSWRSFWVAVGILLLVRLLAMLFVQSGAATGEIFSPVLYADTAIFNSLGSLLLNNLVVSLAFFALFVMRYHIQHPLSKASPFIRNTVIVLQIAATAALAFYIHFVLRSLILNSSIVMEPFRLSDLGGYALLCYLTFAMLILALLFQLQTVVMLIRGDTRINLFSWTNITVYVFAVALYSVIAMSVYGLNKEYENNRVNTGKLAIERDLSLEMFLRDVEPQIQGDPIIATLSSVGGMDLIRDRLSERYLNTDDARKYNITISTCSPDNLLNLGLGAEPVRCFAFYENLIKEYGVQLAQGSNVYYLRNYNGLSTYLALFTFFNPATYEVSRLFIEFESKYRNDVMLNPLDAVTARASTAPSLSRRYSYARYSDDRLVSYGGSYDYPVAPPQVYDIGYSMVNKEGWLHFVNRLTEDDLTVISRPRRPLFPHLVSFSYLAIFYGLFLLAFTRRGRRDKLFNLPKHSLKRRITLLITLAMVFAIGTMGVGTVVFVMGLNRENNREAMDRLMTSAQTSLAESCKYAMRYNDINTPELFTAMESFSQITRSDLNLYNTHGELIRSTKPELFDQFLVGKRMNNKAFRQIVKKRQLRFTDLETIAGVKFYSIYEPLFNGDGDMVAIINVPYFTRNEDATTVAASTISVIINIYLILLIAAVALAAVISNSLSRPLVEIKERIDRLALSGNRRIKYHNTKDELGVLIASYNKMVEDLEESTRRLAQSEREQAWKEMARQIAHEIKNPLTPMKLSIQYLIRLKEMGTPGWDEKFESVSKSLLEQIDTLAQTATEFSSFAQMFGDDITSIDLCGLVAEQRDFFDNREDISFECRMPEGPAMVEARRRPLSRVLVNLITNAIQALESAGSNEGKVRITLAPDSISGNPAWRLDVEDNGPGVGEEDFKRLFTPNFTTKKTGTGLGLAISRNIIEERQGTIGYSRSEDLGGACFSILLPAS